MRYLPAILIYLSFIVAELHHFAGDELVRVSLYNSSPMPAKWAIKYTTDQLVWILIAIALYNMNQLRVNIAAAKVLLCWVIFDTITYFWNYKTSWYGITYFVLACIIVVNNMGLVQNEKRN